MIAAALAVIVLAAVGVFLALRLKRREAHSSRSVSNEAVLAEFVVRSLDLPSFQEVLADAAATGQTAFGATRAVVFEPGAKEGLWDAWAPGPQPLEAVPDASRAVFAWLKHNAEVISLDDVSGARFGAMRLPLADLKTRYGIDTLVPLVDRRQTLAAFGLALGRRPGALERGLLEHLRIEATAASANVRLHREAAVKLTLEKEVDLASAVQRTLVPAISEGTYGALEWVGHYRAAGQAGSDFWCAYELMEGRLMVVLGDVIGTGVSGSMVSAVAKSCCDALAARVELGDPGALLTVLNRALYRPVKPIHMTSFAVLFDPEAGEISWANAGHSMPYVLDADGERLGVLSGAGRMLGDEPDSRYPTQRRPLAPGDEILLFTDGVVETMNAQRVSFGERRLQRAFSATRGGAPTVTRDRVLAALEEFRGGVAPVDDEILVVVRRG